MSCIASIWGPSHSIQATSFPETAPRTLPRRPGFPKTPLPADRFQPMSRRPKAAPSCQTKMGISGKVEAFTDPQTHGALGVQRPKRNTTRRRRFLRRLSCDHVDQVDEKASSRRRRPRPPCTSQAKHQCNDENQVLEDRVEVAEEAEVLVLDHAVGVAKVLSWLAQGA